MSLEGSCHTSKIYIYLIESPAAVKLVSVFLSTTTSCDNIHKKFIKMLHGKRKSFIVLDEKEGWFPLSDQVEEKFRGNDKWGKFVKSVGNFFCTGFVESINFSKMIMYKKRRSHFTLVFPVLDVIDTGTAFDTGYPWHSGTPVPPDRR